MTTIAGASLFLRCDDRTSPACKQLQHFTALRLPECRKEARAAGWLIRRTACVCGPCAEQKS